jgi:hypothetical protein
MVRLIDFLTYLVATCQLTPVYATHHPLPQLVVIVEVVSSRMQLS